jgi:hypothetical protein
VQVAVPGGFGAGCGGGEEAHLADHGENDGHGGEGVGDEGDVEDRGRVYDCVDGFNIVGCWGWVSGGERGRGGLLGTHLGVCICLRCWRVFWGRRFLRPCWEALSSETTGEE